MTAVRAPRLPWLRFLALAAALSFASACSDTVTARGNEPNPDMLAMLAPGEQTRDDVQALLGTPSDTSTFDQETWYYISAKFEKRAFLAPEEIERKIVAVRFTDDGYIQDVHTFTLEDGKVVAINDRATPTMGNEMSIVQQLLGNIGRFEQPQ